MAMRLGLGVWLAAVVVAFVASAGVQAGSNLQAKPLEQLWRIGESDGAAGELALSSGDFARISEVFPDDPLFIVGRSQSATAWPAVQPGPADTWAGGRRHTFSVLFGLSDVPASGPCRLSVDLVDAHHSLPPRFEVSLNGQASEHQTSAGSSDAVETRGPASHKQRFVAEFPASVLRVGNNTVTITSLSGSWFIYDAVSFEVAPGVRLAPVESATALLAARSTPVLLKQSDGRTASQVELRIRHTGDPIDATARIADGQPMTVHLGSGIQTVTFAGPAVERATEVTVTLTLGQKVVGEQSVVLKPVRPWVIYLLPHSHNDIGYTDIQPEIERKQWNYLDLALDTARRTQDYPDGARFRWNVEVMWAIDGYLRQASPEKQQAFVDAVKSGWIELDALYGNELTALCRAEELVRLITPAAQVAQRCGVPLEAAMISDVPGYTWGLVPVLAQAGVKFFSVGPNSSDRIGGTLAEWGDKPFYWLSPSGEEKVLCWIAGKGYAFFHGAGLAKMGAGPLLTYLEQLEQAGYPYDLVQVRYTVGGDNGPPEPALCDFVKEWHETHAAPRFVIATTSEMCREFERRYRDKIPEVRGDFTPYWEDGAASTARETALNRTAAERLIQAETLFALLAPESYPPADFNTAWRNIILYDEHTWGAWNSISAPDAPSVQQQWAIKQAFALDADRQSRELLARALGGSRLTEPVAAIDVFNTSSWPRTDLVLVPPDLKTAGEIVVGPDGRPVPAQRLSTGELAFIATSVPPLAAARYTLTTGSAARVGAARADGVTLTTPNFDVRIDEQTGAISSLRSSAVRAELVATESKVGCNDYRYMLGSDVAGARSNGPVTITGLEKGPLVAALRIESDAPGCHRLIRDVRVVDGLDYIEILNTVDKLPVREKEGVHFGFAFNVPDGQMRLDIPWAVVRPEVDQLPGSCKNWLTLQRWADISNASFGVTWTTVDAPLIEIGGLTADRVGSLSDPKAWIAHLAPSQTLYSWVMNNHWHTNYRAEQEGKAVFRYAIRPHGTFDFADVQRFGIERTQPLLVRPAIDTPKNSVSLFRVEGEGVMVTLLKPSADGRAWIVRLFNPTDRAAQVDLRWGATPPPVMRSCNLLEEGGPPVSGPLNMPPWSIRTLRCERPAGT